jgi:hypothetical protein
MRLVTAVSILLAIATPALAAHRHYHYRRSWSGCGYAAAHGGPCGCVAMRMVGITDTRFWQVRSWRAFRRTSPHVGAAAIWRNHSHVEIVSAVNRDGTVNTRGSVGHNNVPVSRLVFVQSRGRGQ